MPGSASGRSPLADAQEHDGAVRAAEVNALRAELERLRDSEKMYRASAQLSGRLVWSTDASGNMLAMSQLFRKLTGIEDEETLKRTWPDAIHPDDREGFMERWSQSLRTGEPFSAEFRSVLVDGTVRRALSKAIPVRDDSGRILRWYGSTEDIEEEWQARCAERAALAQLRESEDLHRVTLELSEQIAWSVEPDGSGLTLSPRYYELTGMDPEAAPELSIHPEDRERFLKATETALANGRPFSSECRLCTASGEYRYFRMRAAPFRDAEGGIVRWYGITADIHEERAAEQARREVEERYRLAVQATNDAVWDYDIVNGTIDWSENSATIFRSAKPIGRTGIGWWEERVHADDRTRIVTSLSAAIEGGETHWSATYRFLREDGSYAEMLDRGFLIRDVGGNTVRAVGAMADLTERNRAEAEIRQMQNELIHVSRLSAMGAMASTLAHELNQPLAAVSNYIGGAKRLAARDGAVTLELIEALDAAGAMSYRAGEIVRRLRELVSRGTVAVLAQRLPELINEASVLGFVDEALRGIQHRFDFDPAAQWVLADRIQIQQVLINLMRNAVEAMAECDRREILVSTRDTGSMIEISIADSGPGVPPEQVHGLFSHFMTTKSGGMGIGLPISRTIVELHGGKIWAENRPEGGAIFRFTLPKATPPKQKRG